MAPRDEDLAFLRYRQTGRAEFLGQVFDQTAPGLLLVACHLARGAEGAEDLVQQTFVTAIAAAARYDAGQPVFRWLAGILANHAREARRRAARALDPTRLPGEPVAAPDAEAEAGEVAEAVARALDELPEIYRTVLVLRLRHGLEPIEIAHALGRSPETVRTQLYRGLDKLRAALPASFALTALAAVVLQGRGLTAVRAAVMGQAVATVSVTGMAFGGLLMANKLLVAAGCAVLLLGGAAVCWTWGSAAGASVGDTQPAAVVAPAASRTNTAAPGPSPDSKRLAVEPAASPTTDTVLTGRCVDAERGLPLPGCAVTLAGVLRRDQPPAPGWRDPQPVTTGADGRFRFGFAMPNGYLLVAAVEHPERIRIRAVWDALLAGTTHDVGDVRLPLGVGVRGQLVDEDSQPIANTGIRAALEPLPFGSQRGQNTSAQARSQEGGAFDLGLLPVGEHELKPVGTEFQLVSPKSLVLTGVPRTLEQRVVLRATPCLAGTVVDPAGAPIAGLTVSEAPELDHVGARTDPRGEFRLYARDARRGPVRLRFVQFPTQLKPLSIEPSGPLPWGTRDIRVVLPRPDPENGSGARLRVVDARTGAPVEEFGYYCGPDQTQARDGYDGRWQRKQAPRHHPQGVVELTDLHPSPHLAVVYPSAESLAAGGPVFFDAKPGATADVEVRLRPPTDFRVQVVRRDGTAVAGTEVELLHALGKPPSLTTHALPMDRAGAVGMKDVALVRGRSPTGPDGVAVLRAPAGEAGMTVRVLTVECLGLVVRDVAIPDTQTEPLRVVVDSGATLRGRVVPADVVSRMARREPPSKAPLDRPAGLVLRSLAGDARQGLPIFGYCFPVADDGSYRITGVPPGAWAVQLFWFSPLVEDRSSSHSFAPPLATVTVADGQVVTMDLDASAFRPASLRGQILMDGRPLADTTWGGFRLEDERVPQSFGGAPTDADGRFRSDAVMPGRYVLAVLPGKRGKDGRQWRQILEPLEVGPGDTVERTFHVAPATSVVVALTAHDGVTPAADCTVYWLAHLGYMATTISGTLTTDASGTARIDAALILPIELHREPDDAERQLPGEERQRRTLLGTVERVPGRTELHVHIRLPAK